MVHVGVGQENGVNRREIVNAKTRTSLPPEHDQPRSKDRINEKSLAGGLDEKRRMTDKGDGCISRADIGWSG